MAPPLSLKCLCTSTNSTISSPIHTLSTAPSSLIPYTSSTLPLSLTHTHRHTHTPGDMVAFLPMSHASAIGTPPSSAPGPPPSFAHDRRLPQPSTMLRPSRPPLRQPPPLLWPPPQQFRVHQQEQHIIGQII
jgi:hypothetical protein